MSVVWRPTKQKSMAMVEAERMLAIIGNFLVSYLRTPTKMAMFARLLGGSALKAPVSRKGRGAV